MSTAAPPPPTASSATVRGRPREFDDETVLDAVVHLFWNKGYEATSVADIVDTTGLSKSSLYSAFGSKDALFEKALNRYIDFRSVMLTEILVDGSGGLDDFDILLDFMWSQVAEGEDYRGCLAVNTSTELGTREPKVVAAGQRYREVLHEALVAPLERAADRGEIAAGRVDLYANILASAMLGMAVLVRSGAESSEIRSNFDSIRELIDSWRIQPPASTD